MKLTTKICCDQAKKIGPHLSRLIAAVGGGYALAALSSIATLALPVAKPQAVLIGMLSSFLVYVLAIIWVYAAQSARNAWRGLWFVALLLGSICYFFDLHT